MTIVADDIYHLILQCPPTRWTETILSATNAYYSNLISQGYYWDTNSPAKEAEERAQKIRDEGLSVVVGPVAFVHGHRGRIVSDPDYRAIIVKKPVKS